MHHAARVSCRTNGRNWTESGGQATYDPGFCWWLTFRSSHTTRRYDSPGVFSRLHLHRGLLGARPGRHTRVGYAAAAGLNIFATQGTYEVVDMCEFGERELYVFLLFATRRRTKK